LWLIDPVTVTIEMRYATVREDQPEICLVKGLFVQPLSTCKSSFEFPLHHR
jgi:hypothetical protein